MNSGSTPQPLPHARPTARMTPGERFAWTCVLGGAFGAVIKFLLIAQREEKLIEDFMGTLSKLPEAVQMAVRWQRFVGSNFLYLVVFIGLPLLVWIWCSQRRQLVRRIVLAFAVLAIVQGLVCVLVTGSQIPALIRSLDGPPSEGAFHR